MECGACGRENPEAAKFCRGCGAPMLVNVVCPACQAPNLPDSGFCTECGRQLSHDDSSLVAAQQIVRASPTPVNFANGRYQVRDLLGEGGKKRVYLAHDTLLDRDVAFALIKTESLDDAGRARVRREARAMGRLGSHPHIVSVLDLGDESGQPYLVTELMAGGDLEAILDHAPDHRLPLDQSLRLAAQVCLALEHAHAHGVIHRDLKPGNIWLTSDGTAKLGDLGLAVALDQSRLTQPGMMVGTVSYMAPEQAIGGSVDARSDLYGLGCVLYEMLCGRPPFIGDESVAIITQHLNTPPVAPSWHRPDVPTGLETLILRLLEKDPAQRPASAAEVSQALSNVQDAPPPGSLPPFDGGSEGGPAATNPLYHRAFVGRESELRQLQAIFDAALSGQGGLAMVVGEPGIGKTSLCEQLATYVTVRGGTALIGHCYEEGSLSLPYLPFVEAMRSYVLARDPDGLKSDLGTGAGEVARIVSEVRDRVPVPDRPAGDPEEERWRLLQSVTGFLRNASQVQPLLIVLEDLHDADRGTLDLLLHLSRNLDGARLLFIGTYRDVEVDRSHPLSSALAELRRSSSFSRVPLRGLTPDEVQRMMASVTQRDIPWLLSELVHRQTEGNPLFVQEMLRYLVEEGMVETRDGSLRRVGEETLAGRIPEGLRDVIGKRLSRLSEATNQVLAVAAVIGREFRLDVLQRVANLTDDAMDTALAQAQERAIVEQRSTVGALVFRFTHAFFRQTLYEEIFASRRLRLHQQVARALEEVYGRRVEEHASELAEHFAQSTDPADLAKALHYSELASQRSMQVFAYGEAAQQLDQALKVQEVLDPDAHVKRCDLLLAMMEALLPTDEPEKVDVVAPQAFALAERMGDGPRAATIAVLAMDAIGRAAGVGAVNSGSRPEYQEWASRADKYAPPDSVTRVYADAHMGAGKLISDRAEAFRYLRRAVELARSLDDNHAYFAAASWAITLLRGPRDVEVTQALARSVLQHSRDGARAPDVALSLFSSGEILLESSDRAGAEQAWQELTVLANRTGDATMGMWVNDASAVLAFVDGRLDDAADIGKALVIQANERGIQGSFRLLLARVLLYQGRTEEAAAVLDWLQRVRPAQASRACMLAHLGRREESQRIRGEFDGIESDADESAQQILVGLLEAAVLNGDCETARALARRLTPFIGFPFTNRTYTSYGRLLGGAAALLGEPAQARRYYQQAIQACEKIRFRPELAITHLELAELLLDHYPDERRIALEHLDFAVTEFQTMNMPAFLERSLRRKLQLQGVDSVSPSTSIDAVAIAVESERPNLQPHAAPDGTVTLLFTDIEGSTGLTVRLGDQRWLEILRAHHALVRQQVHDHGGFEVKSQGDGFMLAFGSARRALDCAIAIQRSLTARAGEVAIRVRMGLHTGEALRDANDFHGRDVVLAARIADQARGGEILVSALLKSLLESRGDLRFDDGRETELKGLTGTQRMYGVVWA